MNEEKGTANIAYKRELRKYYEKKSEAPRYLMYIETIMLFIVLGVAVYSWLKEGTFPYDLVRYVSALYGFSLCGYYCKTAYEHKVDREHDMSQGER